jgi:hypothetical protein
VLFAEPAKPRRWGCRRSRADGPQISSGCCSALVGFFSQRTIKTPRPGGGTLVDGRTTAIMPVPGPALAFYGIMTRRKECCMRVNDGSPRRQAASAYAPPPQIARTGGHSSKAHATRQSTKSDKPNESKYPISYHQRRARRANYFPTKAMRCVVRHALGFAKGRKFLLVNQRSEENWHLRAQRVSSS